MGEPGVTFPLRSGADIGNPSRAPRPGLIPPIALPEPDPWAAVPHFWLGGIGGSGSMHIGFRQNLAVAGNAGGVFACLRP